MSCQKALLRTTANNLITETNNNCDNHKNTYQSNYDHNVDPYVFTEVIPTTPPAFFNTQKFRTRLAEVNLSTSSVTNNAKTVITYVRNELQNCRQQSGEQYQQKLNSIITNEDTVGHSYGTFSNTIDEVHETPSQNENINSNNSNTNKCISTISTYPIISDSKIQLQPIAITTSSNMQLKSGGKKLTNVCIVRPQQQQPSPLHADSTISEEIKPLTILSTATLPSHYTSSAWQTPYLIGSGQRVPGSNCHTHILSVNSTVQCYSSSALHGNGANTISVPATAAMAKVTPIVPVPPTNVQATKLPPSNFHQNTMAQQLQKVEILKKPNLKDSDALTVQSPSLSLQYLTDTPAKHSKNDENFHDISVNAVYQVAMIPDHRINNHLKRENTTISSPISALNSSHPSIHYSSSRLKTQNIEYSSPTLTDALLFATVVHNSDNYKSNTKMSSIRLLGQNEKTNNVLPLQEKNQLINVKINKNNKLTSIKTLVESQNFNNSINIIPLPEKKKSRKVTSNISYPTWPVSNTVKGAVAVIKMSQNDASNDISLMASASSLPYCLQHNWLSTYSIEALPLTAVTINREERIIKHKEQLRHEAEQLLSIRSLQKLPLQLAKRRLLCVKRLLYKYNQPKSKNGCVSLNAWKHCAISGCDSWCVEMASYCRKHIVQNITQQLFMPCTVKYVNNGHCDTSVFDITQELPLCIKHSHMRNEMNNIFKEQQKLHRIVPATVLMPQSQIKQSIHTSKTQKLLSQDNNSHLPSSKCIPTSVKRKMTTLNTKGRPQKRTKKIQATVVNCNKSLSQSSLSIVQRHPTENVCTIHSTSLESIPSKSHQSSCLSTPINYIKNLNNGSERTFSSFGPASFTCGTDTNNYNNNNTIPSLNLLNCENTIQRNSQISEADNLINQFTLTNHYLGQQDQRQNEYQTNSISNTNSNSNYTSSGMGSMVSLPCGDDIFTQDVLNICENTSGSSADICLGGLGDPELMLCNATDADIRLSDDHLLGEHVLDNVLSFLPEDTFKEIFATVHLDENGEIERAIEIADKGLQTLQQSIGSDLNDFLDFRDHIIPGPTEFVNDTTNPYLC